MDTLSEVLGKITGFLKSEANAETIIGSQFALGEFSCVPVMSLGIGFGGGSGEGKDDHHADVAQSGIGGGGMGLSPVGFLVTRGSEIQFIPVRSNKGLSAAFEKVPGLLEKLFSQKQAGKA